MTMDTTFRGDCGMKKWFDVEQWERIEGVKISSITDFCDKCMKAHEFKREGLNVWL